jgi:[calcium/calmodulin-dependent protein kinase] kinase
MALQETLNAHSEYTNSQDDGKSQHHINQYIIGEEIGRGSFGAVHLATDQYGHEFVSNDTKSAHSFSVWRAHIQA